MAKMLRLFASLDLPQFEAGIEGKTDEAEAADTASNTIRGVVCCTQAQNRNGWTTKPEGISTANFAKNPILLWNHSTSDPKDVLGKVLNPRLESNGDSANFVADFEFDTTNPKAVDVLARMKAKTIRACSIGIRPLKIDWDANDDPVFLQSDLMEVSICPIGADPDALMAASADSVDYFRAEYRAEKELNLAKAELATVQTELATVKASLASANAQIEGFKKASLESKVDALLNAASTRVTPASRASLRVQGLKDPAWLEAHLQTLPELEMLKAKSPKAAVQSNVKPWAQMTDAEKVALYERDPEAFKALRSA